jgi:hypothetical protein
MIDTQVITALLSLVILYGVAHALYIVWGASIRKLGGQVWACIKELGHYLWRGCRLPPAPPKSKDNPWDADVSNPRSDTFNWTMDGRRPESPVMYTTTTTTSELIDVAIEINPESSALVRDIVNQHVRHMAVDSQILGQDVEHRVRRLETGSTISADDIRAITDSLIASDRGLNAATAAVNSFGTTAGVAARAFASFASGGIGRNNRTAREQAVLLSIREDTIHRNIRTHDYDIGDLNFTEEELIDEGADLGREISIREAAMRVYVRNLDPRRNGTTTNASSQAAAAALITTSVGPDHAALVNVILHGRIQYPSLRAVSIVGLDRMFTFDELVDNGADRGDDESIRDAVLRIVRDMGKLPRSMVDDTLADRHTTFMADSRAVEERKNNQPLKGHKHSLNRFLTNRSKK